MINGLNVLPSSDKHHINANKYDCYFNTNEQRIYVHDGIKWVCLSVADPSLNNNYLLEQRYIKIKKIRKIIKS